MSETVRVRGIYERQAGRYDRTIAVVDRILLGDARPWDAGQARGKVLALAVGHRTQLAPLSGNSSNHGHRRERRNARTSRRRAADRRPSVDAQLGDAQVLPFADEAFDTVVATSPCAASPTTGSSTGDGQGPPAGRTPLLCRARRQPYCLGLTDSALLEPVRIKVAGDHLTRDPRVSETGLRVDTVHRNKLGLMLRLAAHKDPDRRI